MATDFFERQSAARRSTKWLVVLFSFAVVAIVGIVFLASLAAVGGFKQYASQATTSSSVESPLSDVDYTNLQWEVPLGACAVTLLLIGGGSLFKIAQLNGGGTTVAESVGGMRIAPNTTDPLERRLLNIVEEMALASGVPVPPVFMLPEEQGINAFAAGYSPSDAVVAVTRGTAEQLSRDELQGVVAHEFSHILNGDMRLNIRLIGLLHGILLLSLVGRILFRMTAYSGRRRSKNDSAGAILVVGLVLIIIGSIGALMGNLIKAAVSRQREFLADASAVQFTRNPGGIAGALKRIGAAIKGSLLKHPNAAEMSHLYFGQGVWEGFSGLMATHPPLKKRILRLEPNWDGKYPETPATPAAIAELAGMAGFVGGAVNTVPLEVVAHAAEQVGYPTEIHRTLSSPAVEPHRFHTPARLPDSS
jgi:Zn-dependent protease with chaperone function